MLLTLNYLPLISVHLKRLAESPVMESDWLVCENVGFVGRI